MKTLRKPSLTILFLLIITLTKGQSTVAMADSMRADGKIYVVVAIILAILFGFVGYLVILDRRIGKIEKKINDNVSNKVN